MKITQVTEENLSVYLQLAQCYEAEFSKITKKRPNKNGIFELDTEIGDNVKGFLLYIEESPAGFIAVLEKEREGFEICEFYIVPSFRGNSWGSEFAHAIWKNFPGKWQVKQLEDAKYATEFWHKVIASYSVAEYTEDRFHDPYWGLVTRQRFEIMKSPR